MAKRGRKTAKPKVEAKAKDDKGYLDSNKDAFTDYKVIRGNKITMEGVSGKIYAIPIDKKGNAGRGRLMNTGENHEFEGASHIIEVPEVAMAQAGVNTGSTGEIMYPLDPNKPRPQGTPNDAYNQWANEVGIMNMPFQESNEPITDPVTTEPTVTPPPSNTMPTQADFYNHVEAQRTGVSDGTEEERKRKSLGINTNVVPKVQPQQRRNLDIETNFEPMNIDWGKSAEEQLQESVSGTQNLEKVYQKAQEGDNEVEETEKIQFDNPYGGVDIPTAAQTLGASLSYDGDMTGSNTARGVASGLKLLTGLGRNVMSGYAQNKRNQWVTEAENEKQRGVLQGNTINAQSGGSIAASEGAGTPPSYGTPNRRKKQEVTPAELLSGAFTTGDPNTIPNVEVEGGEHIKDNQTGQVQEVKGNKHSQGGEPMNLEDHKVLSDYTKIGGDLAKKYRDEFDVKVKAKDTYATVMDKILKKTGYKSITDELTSTIEKTEKEQEKAKEIDSEATTGINMQFLSGKINDLTKELEPLESLKSNVFETLFADQQGSKTVAELSEEGAVSEMQEGGEVSRERFKSWIDNLRSYGFEGEVDLDAEDLGAEAGKAQQWMLENHPEAVVKYFTENGQPITAKGIDLIKENNPHVFEKAGIDSRKPSASYTEEEKERLKGVMEQEGTYDDNFILQQFNDNKFEYRAPLLTSRQQPRNVPSSGMEVENLPNLYNPSLLTEDRQPVKGTVDENDDSMEGTGNRTALLPDQHILPPSTMQPHRLAEITPREAEAKLISPNSQIEEINRQFMAAKSEINSLPDTQRRAALAQLNAQTQQNINQVMSQTNRANAQIEGQNEERNIQRKTQADMFNEQAANTHEQLQLTAKDKTEQEIRNYFNAQNRKQVANYNTIQNMNLTNAMYDNFQYDGNGRIIQTGKGLSQEAMDRASRQALALQKEAEEEKKKKKTATAKRGRKIKK